MRFLVRSAIVASLLEWTVRSSGDHGIADGVHVLIGAHVPHLHRLVQPRGQDLVVENRVLRGAVRSLQNPLREILTALGLLTRPLLCISFYSE